MELRVVGTNNHRANTKNVIINWKVVDNNSWTIILITTGISSCTGCISHTHPKCTLQQPIVPESKQQQNIY